MKGGGDSTARQSVRETSRFEVFWKHSVEVRPISNEVVDAFPDCV